MRVLVLGKKVALRTIFRLSRFSKILIFLLTNPKHLTVVSAFKYREKFNNHLRLGFNKSQLIFFSLFRSQKLAIGLVGAKDESSLLWAESMQKLLGATIYWEDIELSPIKSIRLQHLASRTTSDLLLVNPRAALPTTIDILQLLMARRCLRPEENISAVHPAYFDSDHEESAYQGFVFDVHSQKWVRNYSQTDEFGQNNVPSWSLFPNWHCLLLSSTAIEELNLSMEDNLGADSEIENISRALWSQNRPIVCYPSVSIHLMSEYFEPTQMPLNPSWVSSSTSHEKVIFVLPATTLSGGIRVVFEVAEGLSERGTETEIWSLNSQISWELSGVKLRQFDNYSSLIRALIAESAIKVATWWETSDVVFLSSILRGLPVQFVQEFETWFYPDHPAGQAAVAASYRPEFRYLTTASYQYEELQSINIEPTLIPVGYESSTYFSSAEISRETDVVLALGRSFFQKNFQMTLRAWKRIKASDIKLWLFGHEPGILTGNNVTYFNRPTNTEVNVLLNKATIFVQTSIHEGFSLPILEAMAAGCPVITTDSHGNRDFCFDKVNCLMVEQDNDEQLAESIQLLLENKSLRDELSREGIKTAKRYQWAGLLDEYSSFFKELSKGI